MQTFESEHEALRWAETFKRANKVDDDFFGDGFKFTAKQVTIRACGLTFKQWVVVCHVA